MTTNLLQNTKDGPQSKEAKALAIGETDANVFNCPACARPLSEGTSKCPGCGAHLIMGVRVKRAAVILALGATLGVLIGGLVTAAAITLSLREPQAAVVAPVAPPPVVASAAPSLTVTLPDLPANGAALSALSGTAVVNGRITNDAATLSDTLGRSNATSIEIARALRSLAADAALGIDLAGRLAPWAEAGEVQTGLDAFYRDVADTARQGLRASLGDVASYREAGDSMLKVLGSLASIDAQSRELAGTVDLEMPPVTLPN